MRGRRLHHGWFIRSKKPDEVTLARYQKKHSRPNVPKHIRSLINDPQGCGAGICTMDVLYAAKNLTKKL